MRRFQMRTYSYSKLIQIGDETNNHKNFLAISIEDIASSLLNFNPSQQKEILNFISKEERKKLIIKKYNSFYKIGHEKDKLNLGGDMYLKYESILTPIEGNEQKCLDMFMILCKIRSDFFENIDDIFGDYVETATFLSDASDEEKTYYSELELIFYNTLHKIFLDEILEDELKSYMIKDLVYFYYVTTEQENLKYEKKHDKKEIAEAEYLVEYNCKDLIKFKKDYPYKSITNFRKKEFFSHMVDFIENKLPQENLETRKKAFVHATLRNENVTTIIDPSIHEQNLNSAFVQIDFSRSPKEIETYIKKLKKDYDENQLVTNPLKLIDYDINSKVYSRKTEHKEIFNLKQAGTKSIKNILETILYIFDCLELNISKESIFSNPILGISTKKTLKKYENIAELYITSKKYENFILSC